MWLRAYQALGTPYCGSSPRTQNYLDQLTSRVHACTVRVLLLGCAARPLRSG